LTIIIILISFWMSTLFDKLFFSQSRRAGAKILSKNA